MSVHGYPADKSFFCNLQLGLLELHEDTSHADIDQDDVSLSGVPQDAVVRARRCWAIICGFMRRDTIADGTGSQSRLFQFFSVPWTVVLRQLK